MFNVQFYIFLHEMSFQVFAYIFLNDLLLLILKFLEILKSFIALKYLLLVCGMLALYFLNSVFEGIENFNFNEVQCTDNFFYI